MVPDFRCPLAQLLLGAAKAVLGQQRLLLLPRQFLGWKQMGLRSCLACVGLQGQRLKAPRTKTGASRSSATATSWAPYPWSTASCAGGCEWRPPAQAPGGSTCALCPRSTNAAACCPEVALQVCHTATVQLPRPGQRAPPLTRTLVLLLALVQLPPQRLHLGPQRGALPPGTLQLVLGLLQAALQGPGCGPLLLGLLPLLLQGAAGTHHLLPGLAQELVPLLHSLGGRAQEVLRLLEKHPLAAAQGGGPTWSFRVHSCWPCLSCSSSCRHRCCPSARSCCCCSRWAAASSRRLCRVCSS